jgi:hypothetical protein
LVYFPRFGMLYQGESGIPVVESGSEGHDKRVKRAYRPIRSMAWRDQSSSRNPDCGQSFLFN